MGIVDRWCSESQLLNKSSMCLQMKFLFKSLFPCPVVYGWTWPHMSRKTTQLHVLMWVKLVGLGVRRKIGFVNKRGHWPFVLGRTTSEFQIEFWKCGNVLLVETFWLVLILYVFMTFFLSKDCEFIGYYLVPTEAHNEVKYAAYRTSLKLRHLQKRLYSELPYMQFILNLFSLFHNIVPCTLYMYHGTNKLTTSWASQLANWSENWREFLYKDFFSGHKILVEI